jgi:hypothetical protein
MELWDWHIYIYIYIYIYVLAHLYINKIYKLFIFYVSSLLLALLLSNYYLSPMFSNLHMQSSSKLRHRWRRSYSTGKGTTHSLVPVHPKENKTTINAQPVEFMFVWGFTNTFSIDYTTSTTHNVLTYDMRIDMSFLYSGVFNHYLQHNSCWLQFVPCCYPSVLCQEPCMLLSGTPIFMSNPVCL